MRLRVSRNTLLLRLFCCLNEVEIRFQCYKFHEKMNFNVFALGVKFGMIFVMSIAN